MRDNRKDQTLYRNYIRQVAVYDKRLREFKQDQYKL